MIKEDDDHKKRNYWEVVHGSDKPGISVVNAFQMAVLTNTRRDFVSMMECNNM